MGSVLVHLTSTMPSTTPDMVPVPSCLETNLLSIERSADTRLQATAKKHILAGTVITRNAPLSHKLNYATDSCSYCSASQLKLKKCSSCHTVQYCGRDCQRNDFVQHKLECQFLKSDRSLLLHDEQDELCCLLLRTIGALTKLEKKKQISCQDGYTIDGNGIGTICCGLDHWHGMARVPSELLLQQGQSSIEQIISKYANRNSFDIHKILCIFQANNFGILSSNGLYDTVGQGVYPHAAILNHSCHPNCLLRFCENVNVMEIVALRDIKSGEELTHSYVDLVHDTSTRQQHLQQLHGFVCDCVRCSYGQGASIIANAPTVRLPVTIPNDTEENRHNLLYDWIIQNHNPTSTTSGTTFTNDKLGESVDFITLSIDEAIESYGIMQDQQQQKDDTLQQAQELQRQARQHMANDDLQAEMKTLQDAIIVLQQQHSISPLSRDLYQVRGAYLSSLLAAVAGAEEQEPSANDILRAAAQEQCLAMVAFLSVALPQYHPLLGLQLFTLGDLLSGNDDLISKSITGRSIYKWARVVLRISHSQDHELVRRLDALLQAS